MQPLRLTWLIVPLMFATPAFAQNSQQRGTTTVRSPQSTTVRSQSTVQSTAGGSRSAVAIQPPTNNPFQNPIGQGVAPAANANSNRNSNVITTPSR
jgi:hypothetical protein